MREIFTKSFWDGVKKTFHEAREGSPPADGASQTPAKGDQSGVDAARTASTVDRVHDPGQTDPPSG